MRRWLPETAYSRPVTVLMVFVALLVLGALAWVRIPIQLMPEGFEPHFLWVQVPFPNASPAETDASFDAMVAHNRKSAKSHSGIWRDLAVRKRKTEVDPQLTLPVEIGRKMGRDLPLTRCLVELIQDIESGRRRLSLETLDALKASHEGGI